MKGKNSNILQPCRESLGTLLSLCFSPDTNINISKEEELLNITAGYGWSENYQKQVVQAILTLAAANGNMLDKIINTIPFS